MKKLTKNQEINIIEQLKILTSEMEEIKLLNMQLINTVSTNYMNAMEIKKKLIKGEVIELNDFDLDIIIERSYHHLNKLNK